jgi:hypothetical protein
MKRICILVLALVVPGVAMWSCATSTDDPFGDPPGEGGAGGEGNGQGGSMGQSSGTGMGGASGTTSTTTTSTTGTTSTTSTTSTSSGGNCDPIQCNIQCLPMGQCGECSMGACVCKPFEQCGAFDAGLPEVGLPDLGFP